MAASRSALLALILRDLVVLRKNFVEFVIRTLVQPFLLVFVFLYVFPTIGQGVGGGGGKVGRVGLRHRARPGRCRNHDHVPGHPGGGDGDLDQEFGFTREIEDRVQAPCPIWLVAVAKVLSGATQGLIAALIVFPIASVVHASGVEAHLSVSWPVVITLIPLACVTMTSLGLLLGTAFEARNLGLMFGFVVLPLTFLGGTYYQWTEARSGAGRGHPLAADPRAREPAHLRQRGPARRPHPRRRTCPSMSSTPC